MLRDKLRRDWPAVLFLTPSMIGTGLFFFIPFILVIGYSLVDNPVMMRFVFLRNYVDLLTNQAYLQAAGNTLLFSLISLPLVVVMSLLLAMLLNGKLKAKSALRSLFLSPLLVPVASVVLVWQVVFSYHGALNSTLSGWTWLVDSGWLPVDWLKSSNARYVIIGLYLWKNLGYNMVLFLAALNNVPSHLTDSARVDGATAWQRFMSITLRFITPTLLFTTIISFINSFKVFRETYLLAGDYPYDVLYMLQHFMNNMFRSLDYQKLSAAAIVMALVMIGIIGALFIVETRSGKDLEDN
ncbi:MAG: sugar ABC transporter permease [Eubacteriales bacterium]|nr:sugar ABC transporter permease [Eubacteriales bacterium]